MHDMGVERCMGVWLIYGRVGVGAQGGGGVKHVVQHNARGGCVIDTDCNKPKKAIMQGIKPARPPTPWSVRD